MKLGHTRKYKKGKAMYLIEEHLSFNLIHFKLKFSSRSMAHHETGVYYILCQTISYPFLMDKLYLLQWPYYHVRL